MSWDEAGLPWYTQLGCRTVKLTAAGAGRVAVDLSLDFAGTGVYSVRVNVQSEDSEAPVSPDVESRLPVSSAIELAGLGKENLEVGLRADDSPSGAFDMENSEAGWETDAGGHEMAPGGPGGSGSSEPGGRE